MNNFLNTVKYVTQCVEGSFFVQKLQILEKLEKWLIFISVSKLTTLSAKKFQNIGIFAPKLVKQAVIS